MNMFCYKEEEKVCIQSDLEVVSNIPMQFTNEEPGTVCMSGLQGCLYKGVLLPFGTGRCPRDGICGGCIGGGLFEESPVHEHEECSPPFFKLQFDHLGKTYKY